MDYEWNIQSLTEGALHPIAPKPTFAPEIGMKVRLKAPYMADPFRREVRWKPHYEVNTGHLEELV